METKKMLFKILSSFEFRISRLYFIYLWLEDINFHKENEKILEMITEKEKEMETDLNNLYLVANEKMIDKKRWEYLKDIITEKYTLEYQNKMIDKLNNNEGIVLSSFISYKLWKEYINLKQLQPNFCFLYGWGVDNNAMPILETIEEILKKCEKIDRDRFETKASYWRD